MSNNTTRLSSKRRWLSSERIALEIVEALGYRVMETRKKIVLNGVEVGEVDIVAVDDDGNTYAIEVKAGRADVTSIRQAYVNALLLNSKPVIVCKGFADDAAKELSERLGVKIVQLSDVFLVESEELNIIVRDVVEETLTEYLELFYGFNPNIKQEHLEILTAIYSTATVDEAAEKLGIDVPSLMKKIEDLRRLGIIPKWAKKYSSIKRVAQILLQKQNISSALDESKKLVESVKSFYDQLKQLQNLLTSLGNQVQRLTTYLSKLESELRKTEEPTNYDRNPESPS